MSSDRGKTLRQLESQQKRISELTRELSELNLSVSATLNELHGQEKLTGEKVQKPKEGARARKVKTKICVGDLVEVVNTYRGKQGNLCGRRGRVVSIGTLYVKIDIPGVIGFTLRHPSNLKLLSASTPEKKTKVERENEDSGRRR